MNRKVGSKESKNRQKLSLRTVSQSVMMAALFWEESSLVLFFHGEKEFDVAVCLFETADQQVHRVERR
jgi:hypothetical protein